jgi:hypothetical protein
MTNLSFIHPSCCTLVGAGSLWPALEDANLTETLEHYDAVAAHSLGGASSRVSQFALHQQKQQKHDSAQKNLTATDFSSVLLSHEQYSKIKGLFFHWAIVTKFGPGGKFRLQQLADERASSYCYWRRMWKFNDPE